MGYENIQLPEGARFLVTGAAGFIGSNLVEAILNKGHKVRGLDNFSSGKRQNIAGSLHHPNFEFIEGDIVNFQTCLAACDGIDFVLHQAALGSVPRSMKEPLIYEENNIRGTSNMMEAARLAGVKRFIYASSSSVYGDSPTLPKVEGEEGNLLSPYALSKKANELYGKLYTDVYDLECIGLRYFNVFGHRQDPDGYYAAVIPKFTKAILSNETPVINGDGLQSRDFTYIENVIEANLKSCLAKKDATGQAYNIAYGGSEILLELFNKLCELLNKKVEPRFGPDRAGDIKHSHADISKARQLLDYHPEYDFDRGIKLAVNWYKEHLFDSEDSVLL
ncbi:SDR family oxidoreductase [Mesobacillus harenae]|uniref:SDR family oxidoreductase n=1 Tax=Mesobacillus harenae TaxID=2213203 RepID=UPI00158005F2|nr:SDR family oxidoreductase [Mesobacillus harenae]